MNFSKLKLAIKITFKQLLWLIPIGFLLYFVYTHLSNWCNAYFGVTEAQENLRIFLLKVSRTSPSSFSLITSLKELMIETTLSAKFQTLSIISDMCTRFAHLILYLVAFIILRKSLKNGFRTYHCRQDNLALTQDISKALLPEIQSLRQEVVRLSTLLQQKGH